MNDLGQELLTGRPQPVSLGGLDEELLRLWAELGQQARAAIVNLVIYSETEDDELDHLLARVGADHPARLILAIARRDGPDRLEAGLSAHCVIRPGGRKLCSEQITLRAAGDSRDALHATVGRLLLSDLPVFLWWREEPRGHLFARTAELADRVIVDSAALAAGALTRLRALQEDAVMPDLGDLNWARLEPWRHFMAEIFDHPALRPHLGRIRAIRVEGGPSTQGLLLVGWLGSRLGWRLHNGRPAGVAAEIGATQSTAPALVRLESEEAEIEVRHLPQEACVALRAWVEGELRLDRLVQHTPTDTARALARELENVLPDRTYDEALAFAARLESG